MSNNNDYICGLYMFLKTRNFKDHFHISGGAWMTNIWICMTVPFSHNNYSLKFDNLVNWQTFLSL